MCTPFTFLHDPFFKLKFAIKITELSLFILKLVTVYT